MNYQKIIENLAAYKSVLRDFSAAHVSHAYMIKSEDSGLSFEFALMLAANILCKQSIACLSCRTCKNTLKLAHPDIFVYPRDDKKARIVVEDINEILSSSILSGMESEQKVYILKNASDMQAAPQNKLLKILEEPPRGVHFILLAENEESMLVTVRSRVSQIDVEKISTDVIYEYLKSKYNDEDRAKAMAISCNGSISRADEMMSSESYFAMYNDMFSLMYDFNHSQKLVEKVYLLSKYEEDLFPPLYMLQQALRDALMLKTEASLVLNYDKMSIIKNIAANYPQAALIEAIALVDVARNKLKTNCNKTQVIDSLLISILEVRGKCLI